MQFVMIIWLIIIILVLPTEGQHELFKAEMDEKLDTTEDQSFFDIEGKNRVQRNFNEVTYFVDVQYDFDDRFYNCVWNMITNVMLVNENNNFQACGVGAEPVLLSTIQAGRSTIIMFIQFMAET